MTHKQVFLSLFSEIAMSDDPPTGEELVSEIKEAMSPSNLFDPDISKKPPIYGKMKSFLEKLRFKFHLPKKQAT